MKKGRPAASDEDDPDGPTAAKQLKLSDEEIKKRREEQRRRQKEAMKNPKIFLDLKLLSHEHEINGEKVIELPPFFVLDIQRLLLYALQGPLVALKPRWCRLLRPHFISNVGVIVIERMSSNCYQQEKAKFSFVDDIFQLAPEGTVQSITYGLSRGKNGDFFEEIHRVPMLKGAWLSKLIYESRYISMVEAQWQKMESVFIEQFYARKKRQSNNAVKSAYRSNKQVSHFELDVIPRTTLLLNPAQMVREGYPLPFLPDEKFKEFVYTKDDYSPVTDRSPVFALDCEMGLNENKEQELVWISVVDENGECVFESLVKPKARISDYLTRITGVTETMLRPCNVTLSDVQQALRELLPPDAILCGHSLNYDLTVMKMFHPYVIDTSVVYNLSGVRVHKPSLRHLSGQFLGKIIQDYEKTHDPTEDARASLELMQLKLRSGLEFGDIIAGGIDMNDAVFSNLKTDDNTGAQSSKQVRSGGGRDGRKDGGGRVAAVEVNHKDPELRGELQQQKKFFINQAVGAYQNFFEVVHETGKSWKVITDSEKKYDFLGGNKNCDRVGSMKQWFKATKESVKKHQFTLSRMTLEDENRENQYVKINKYMDKLYSSLPNKSLFVVLFHGSDEDPNGICFIKTKTNYS